MSLRTELLKSVWYAFTSLDTEKSGKVSKSQLKVLSHNLYTVLCIPHDPVALEDHFRDDDDGPVSSQGYMPYLNQYILDKAVEGTFVKESLHELCWTLTAKKNYRPVQTALSNRDAFHLWCLFNYLSEDSYPVIMVADEVQYLLQKLLSIALMEVTEVELGDVLSSLSPVVTVWEFLQVMTSPKFLKSMSTETLSIAIQDLYEEVIQDVLKQGYLLKKANLRRTWTERWFILKPSSLGYYLSEECKERKGIITIDKDCGVEILPDRDGRRCMFCVKTTSKTHEMCASDTKHRQEWVTAIQTAIRLQQSGSLSLHRELQKRRREQRELREQRRAARELEMQRLAELQNEKERQQQELEQLREAQKKSEEIMLQEQHRHREQQEEMKRQLECQLREAEEARASMQAEMQLKETEAVQQKQRIQELEQLQDHLQEALAQEIRARHDEEAFRHAQSKLLMQEEEKLRVLLRMREEQTQYVERAQKEKQELQQEMAVTSKELQEAQKQLEDVRENRERADRDVQVAQKKLRQASTNVRHWNIQMNRLMHPISPGEKRIVSGSGFQGLWGIPFTRRDSSLKRLQTLDGKDHTHPAGEHVETFH
ncbi:differentially expressed in FDCP 6 homolog [Xenopus laevis]|uniref:Differentially expressed in FDCP 6 homolog n=1 Tax=Xenopus laevis TaxID=8355 RepID=DEFI6_XENLA|nr:differentially expressed in FDCP 6 homolog [Xenopus laevis]Q6PA69.1 RecName: Full=Differentially expressed in FDCP 6 homolog [Xenopus laevis]AAH60433.1 MGC68775 protein [Xenopus laevis]